LIEVDEILFRVWRRLSATQTLLQLLIHTTWIAVWSQTLK
jgi:hypothetical protein